MLWPRGDICYLGLCPLGAGTLLWTSIIDVNSLDIAGSLQFYRQAEGLDEDAQLFLTTEDDQPFHQDNETNC
jgi:hypothetical protein